MAQTRADLLIQVNDLLPNNSAGDITATDVRTVNNSIINSNLNLLTTDITEVEAGYLKGVTSPIQTQIDSKASLTGATFTGAVSATNLSGANTGDQDISGIATNTSAIATNTTAIATKLSTTGGEMTGAITGNVAITGFRPYLTETTGRTLTVTDSGKFIIANLGTAISFEITTNSIQEFALGTEIDFIQKGSGALSITSVADVFLNGLDSNSVAVTAQWGGVTIKKIAEDEWIAVGKI